MKVLSHAIISLSLVLSSPSFGQGFGDWLKDTAGDIVKKTIGSEDEAPPAPPTSTPRFLTAGIVDKHDYEGELSMQDMLCETIIEPFDLSTNFEAIFEDTIEQNKDKLLSLLSGDASVSFSKQEMLDRVKLQAKRLNWLPMSLEIAYGRRIYELRQEQDTKNVLPPDGKGRVKRLYRKADALVAHVVDSLNMDVPYTFNVLLINNNDVNATALPGGYIFMHTGVLESDHAELVLAHELGHVLKRHQTREAQARLIDSIETVDDLKALIEADQKKYEEILARTVNFYNAFQNYSKNQELQADACAVQIAGRVIDIDLLGMIKLYITGLAGTALPQVFGEETTDESVNESLALLGSGHPDYPKRQEHMLTVANSLHLTTAN